MPRGRSASWPRRQCDPALRLRAPRTIRVVAAASMLVRGPALITTRDSQVCTKTGVKKIAKIPNRRDRAL